jgi:hypothetical protein
MVHGEGFEPPTFTLWEQIYSLPRPSVCASHAWKGGWDLNPRKRICSPLPRLSATTLFGVRRGNAPLRGVHSPPCLLKLPHNLKKRQSQYGHLRGLNRFSANLEKICWSRLLSLLIGYAFVSSKSWWTGRESNPPHRPCKGPSPPRNMPAHSILVRDTRFALVQPDELNHLRPASLTLWLSRVNFGTGGGSRTLRNWFLRPARIPIPPPQHIFSKNLARLTGLEPAITG